MLEVVMPGSGDPDLYVRFDQAPTRTFYDCRPYLSVAEESCSLDVPAMENEAFVMVRGYASGSHTLRVTHASQGQGF
jgi:serine protease